MSSATEVQERTRFPPYVANSAPLSKSDISAKSSESLRVLTDVQATIQNLAVAVAGAESASSNHINKLNDQFVNTLDIEMRLRLLNDAQTQTNRTYESKSRGLASVELRDVLQGPLADHPDLAGCFDETYERSVETVLTNVADPADRYSLISSRYVKFREQIATASNQEKPTHAAAMDMLNGDMGEVVVTQSYICAISGMPFVEPVRATCGHFFSKSSVEHVLSVSAQPQKCPIPGCQSELEVEDFTPDANMERLTRDWLQAEARRRTEQNNEIEHI